MNGFKTAVPADSLEEFMLKKGEEYPPGCYDPSKDMEGYILHKSGKRKSGGGLSAVGRSGKVPSRMGVRKL